MNALLWILQVLLALHTGAGAAWKYVNSEQAVPSLRGIPHGVWTALIVFELLCSLGLVVPVFDRRRLGILAPVAAAGIGAEMLFFSGVHLFSGHALNGQVIYWLVVAVVCAFIAHGRFVRRPL